MPSRWARRPESILGTQKTAARDRRGRGGPADPRRHTLRFALRFFAGVLLISALAQVDRHVFDAAASKAVTHQSASLASSILSLFGAEVRRTGNVITYHSAAFKIIDECTGMEVIGLFVAALLAFPSPWRHRLLGLAIGIPALILLNQIRIATLIVVGAGSATALQYGHVYVWPVIILAVALGMWLQWARIAVRDPHRLV